MFSACVTRLATTCSGLKLQAIITAQIDADNCLYWGNKISEKKYYDDIRSVHPIHSRLLREPEFMVGELYYSSIKNLAINLTSSLEYYLKDNMRLNMMRNYSLLKKIMLETKTVIDPKDIIDIDEIELLREKYIYEISEHVCSGELWKTKFKKYINLLDLPKSLVTEEINNRLDSFWQLRNDIAHGNTRGLTLKYDGNTYHYHPSIQEDEYTQFALLFIALVDEVVDFISKVDKTSLDKWEATDATLLLRKKAPN